MVLSIKVYLIFRKAHNRIPPERSKGVPLEIVQRLKSIPDPPAEPRREKMQGNLASHLRKSSVMLAIEQDQRYGF